MLFLAIKSNGQTQWTPNKKFVKQTAQDSSRSPKKLFQCYGTTQKGERCKRKVIAEHSFCYQHSNQQ